MAITRLNSLAIPAGTVETADLSYPLTNFSSTGIDDNATSTAITIDASENVGVGTASPDGKLNVFSASAGSVSADADADELVLENSGNVGLSLLTASTGESGIYFGNPGTNGQKDFHLKFYHESHATTANRRAFTFNTASTERMRIDSSGNVGIGTASPNSVSKLQVEDITATNTSTYISVVSGNTGNAGITFGDSDADLVGGVLFNNADNALRFFKSGFTEGMRIDASGKVGIGTTSPSSYYADNLVVAAPDQGGITIAASATSDANYLMFADGTSGNEAYRGYIGFQHNAPDALNILSHGFTRFYTGPTTPERMRIDASGNVGIGVAPVAGYGRKLQVHSAAGGGSSVHITDSVTGSTASDGLELITFASAAYIWNREASFMSFGTSATERMRIDSSGNVLVGTTNSGTPSNGIVLYKDNNRGILKAATTLSGADAVAAFYNPNGKVGQIVTNGSTTAYQSLSDYRLKENVVNLDNGIDRLKQIPVHRFNFIADPDKTVDGFIAHEVQDVVPEAITGAKDAVDDEGNPEYQGIDQSKLVPLLTAALQEAVTRIETLEAEVATLKGA
jgi:hypothetical protein